MMTPPEMNKFFEKIHEFLYTYQDKTCEIEETYHN